MNAAVVHSYTAPPRYDTFPDPVAAADELLVNVTAAGLHQVVKSLARGAHYASTGVLPMVPGIDGVGRLPDGARVYFGASRTPFGSMAELSITRRAICLPIPDALDDATVAAIMNPGMSSWVALQARAQFVAGESVLILGATGVAGRLAVQVAKRLGAKRVVATGRNPKALEELKQLGADAVIALTTERDALLAAYREELAANRIDVVLDYLWGAPAETILEAISQKGLQQAASRIRYVQIGSSAAPTISLPAATLRSSNLELLGSGFGSASTETIIRLVGEFIQEAARRPFNFKVTTAPLREVESKWNAPDDGARLVFQP